MKKKIIFITRALWIGGIETALANLLKHFDYEKYEVTLLVCRAELNILERIDKRCRVLIADREQTISFHKCYKYKRLSYLTEEAENPSRFHKAMLWSVPAIKWVENRLYINYIRSAMKAEHFDVAIIYSDVVAEIAIRAINADKFYMFYHHGAMRHVYHDTIGYRKCERIIAVSQNLAYKLRAFVPQYADKIMYIHNLTDVDMVREKGKAACADIFEQDKFNIVSVGRISDEKGMDLAVRACQRLIGRGYTNIKWWIVGDGPDIQKILKMISDFRLENYIVMTGMKKNPYPYIKKADLYVQPSRVEAFGLTIKEAIILEKDVISTNTDGAKEILCEWPKNCLCEVDSDALAEAINNYIENRASFEHSYKIEYERFEKENNESLRALYDLLN